MNWNSYDTKYILKRLIIGFGMLILFSLLTTKKASAEVIDIAYNNNWSSLYPITNTKYLTYNTIQTQNTKNKSGKLVFTVYAVPFTQYAEALQAVFVGDSSRKFNCNIGNVLFYNDSSAQRIVTTAICDVSFNSDGWKYIELHRTTSTDTLAVMFSEWATLTTDNDISIQETMSSQLASIRQKLETGFGDLYSINQAQYNLINSKMSELITSITNNNTSVTTAINNASSQAHADAQAINNSINNDNVDGANTDLDNFKNSSTFSDSTGLQAVLELPLNLVNSFTNTCQPISITIPWLDYTGTIPCMSTIYRLHFNGLYSVVALIVNAFFIYRILIKIYELVHNAKQPDEDKLEVIDL